MAKITQGCCPLCGLSRPLGAFLDRLSMRSRGGRWFQEQIFGGRASIKTVGESGPHDPRYRGATDYIVDRIIILVEQLISSGLMNRGSKLRAKWAAIVDRILDRWAPAEAEQVYSGRSRISWDGVSDAVALKTGDCDAQKSTARFLGVEDAKA